MCLTVWKASTVHVCSHESHNQMKKTQKSKLEDRQPKRGLIVLLSRVERTAGFSLRLQRLMLNGLNQTLRRKEAARLKAEAESDLLAEYSAYRRNAGLHATFLCRTSTDEEKWKLMQIMKRGKNQMKRDLSLVPL